VFFKAQKIHRSGGAKEICLAERPTQAKTGLEWATADFKSNNAGVHY
jgi:hypothetical protein